MRTAAATSTRALFGVVAVAALLASYSGCTNQSSERRGGGDITDLGAAAAAADSEAGAAGAAGSRPALVPWCAAYEVINCVCQQCHQNPPLNHAPLPLVTYDDTQGQYKGSAVKKTVWQEMQVVLKSRFMPFVGDSTVMPPVKPLSDEQQATMLTWLAQGAHDEGGQDCPMTCDWSKGSPTSAPAGDE
jgi:hypothetical protein